MSRLQTAADRLSRAEAPGRARAIAYRAYLRGVRAAERLGLHVVRASYDSPIPRRAELPQDAFERVSPMRAIAWDPEAQLRFVEDELAEHLREWREPPDFRLDNGAYESVDAELLWAIVRWARPARVVELGSGWSSLVTAAALLENATGRHELYDPYPSAHVRAPVEPVSVQDLPEHVVSGLAANDVLFVDTSHTVKLGGDVNRVVLDLLPLLQPGVIVHFHDVFLPGEYSRGHFDDAHFWTEQYLLQAFLMHNRDWEVLASGQALARHAPARLAELVPSFRPGVTSPGAIWLRRVA